MTAQLSPSTGQHVMASDEPRVAAGPCSPHQVSARNWPLVAALNAEWTHLAGLPTVCADGAAWAQSQPELVGLSTAGDVLEAIRGSGRCGADALLHALLTLHAGGDELAGRVVLQTMLGKVVRSVPTARKHRIASPEAECVAAQWEMICTYPLQRRTSVAANLALGALNLLLRLAPAQAGSGDIPVGRCDDEGEDASLPVQGYLACDLEGNRSGQAGVDRALIDTLTWAKQTGALTRPEIEILARVHLHEDAHDCFARLAEHLAIPHSTARARYYRTVHKLAAAVASSIDRPAAW